MRKIITLLVGVSLAGFAQAPAGYYSTINTQQGAALKTALYNIVKTKSVTSYGGLYTAFQTTDRKANGKVWDMYSDIPGGTPPYEYSYGGGTCGNYSSEGDCYNREHSFPQSWFSSASPMVSDIFHLYPTDGKVNGIRSNYPYGEVGTATTTTRNGSKLGGSKSPGYTGTVFEPIDEYKGDFARTYFYLATAYENLIAGWATNGNAGAVLDGTSFPCYDKWQLDVLAKWHNQDPVSAKEIARNNAAYAIQRNRNPFIDNPQWAGAVWGFNSTSTGVATTPGVNTNTGTAFETIVAQDFAACPTIESGWQIVTITGLSWRCSTFGGGQMEANGRISATSTAPGGEGWLISPSINLSTLAGIPILEFLNKSKFLDPGLPHPQMQVFYSTNYNGSAPATATWTALPGVSLAGANATTTTEMTANSSSTLTGFAQSAIHFGFKYNSSASNNNAVRWIVDEFVIKTAIVPISNTAPGYNVFVYNDPIELSTVTNVALAMKFSANNLTANPVMRAESNILISTNAGSGFASSITFTSNNGSVADIDIYVKSVNVFTQSTLQTTLTIAGGGIRSTIENISLSYPTVSDANDILAFNLPTQSGRTTIVGTNIYINVSNADLASVVPTILISEFATIAPLANAAQNFATMQNYTVTSETGSTKIYTVSVKVTTITGGGSNSNDLFISEYIEALVGNFKFIEIYNPTNVAINLGTGGYKIARYSNGATVLSDETLLTGTIASGGTYIIANEVNNTVAGVAQNQFGKNFFNGNDGVVLMKGTTLLDIIGQKGFDPGTEWVAATISTKDQTLRRKANICTGDRNDSDAFNPSIEWESAGTDVFSDLGKHTNTCVITSVAHHTLAQIETAQIFPNPAKSDITIQGLLPNTTIVIVNVFGNEVIKTTANAEIINISVENLNSGMYYVMLTNGLSLQKHKLVIVK